MSDAVQEDLLNIEELQIPHRYGRFWSRFLALLLDGLIFVLVPMTLYNYIEFNNVEQKSSVLLVAILCVRIVYKPFFEYIYGATPGKMALKLRVVNYQYEKASFNEIFLRNIFQVTGGLVGLAIVLFSYYQPALRNLSFLNFNLTSSAAVAVVSVRAIISILYLVDLGFLISSPYSCSLHDRIGKTYVIKVR